MYKRQPQYTGKIKCIYIDPPYNTGKENWVYNDNVNSPLINEWIGKTVDEEDLTRHDKWLTMMTPRIKLLRELLSDDGVIFVSIDDNEAHHLRQLMDEIFGELNFVTTIVWEKKYSPQNDAKWFSDNHDFILCFAKNKENWNPTLLQRTEEMNARYINPDNDPKGVWKLITLHAKSGNNKEAKYTFKNGYVWTPPSGTFARFSLETIKRYEEEGKIWFGKDGKAIPSVKNYLSEVKQGVTPLTVWRYDDVGHNHEAREDLKKIFEGDNPFDTPKPVRLLKRLISLGTKAETDLVLDAFAGSGTTAQALLELNQEDGGKRNFILIQATETTDNEPNKNIAKDITRERVVKVIEKKLENKEVGFEYKKVGQPIDAETILSGQLPTFEQLAKYVFYLATGQTPKDKDIDESKSIAGKIDHTEVYLLYKQDMEELQRLALTFDWAKEISNDNDNKKIIYAPACFLDEEYLEKFNMKFVSIPYNLFERQQ